VKSLSRRALSWLLSSKALDSHMDFELHPTITLRSRSFNVLVATREMFIQALNKNLNLQRFKVLYVAGNYSGILSKLDRRFTELEIRRSFTVFQLMTILEDLMRNADRAFFFEEGPRSSPRMASKAHPKTQKSQTTLEAF
jgi:hypothetical protein